MVDYREILRLDKENYSQRQIEASTGISRHTVSDVLAAAKAAGIEWPLGEEVTNEDLRSILFPGKFLSQSEYLEPDYAMIHKELAKPGVTLTLLWNEYCRHCAEVSKRPYMSTQFGEKYRKWAKVTKATMRIQHKPGDVMEVDWAGNTLTIWDSVTGESSPVYLFVAVLPCSGYAYVEACSDMKLENWLLCHVHAYAYFGGVTRLLIPDNLKDRRYEEYPVRNGPESELPGTGGALRHRRRPRTGRASPRQIPCGRNGPAGIHMDPRRPAERALLFSQRGSGSGEGKTGRDEPETLPGSEDRMPPLRLFGRRAGFHEAPPRCAL